MTLSSAALHEAILAAHAADDRVTLARLYAEGADRARDPAEAGFLLTQAYVVALDAAAPTAPALRARLVALGREDPA